MKDYPDGQLTWNDVQFYWLWRKYKLNQEWNPSRYLMVSNVHKDVEQ